MIENSEEKEEKKVQIGTLNKRWGIKGYDVAEVGHPVYETNDRYIITLTHPTLPSEDIPFYKDTLRPCIDFFDSNNEESKPDV